MKKLVSFYSLSIIFLLLLQTNIFAQNGIPYPKNKKIPEVKIYDSGKIEKFKIEAKNRRKSGELPKSTFEVTYQGFSIGAQAAFAEAVNLWSYLISSEVPIKINAFYQPLGTGVLGSASASSYRRTFKNAPYDSVWYPIPLANKLAGYDIDPEIPDITANFSSTFDWYLGLDGNCPDEKYDFISVVMHEIGHGLGFAGSANVDGTMGSWGYDTPYPFIYDVFVFNGKDKQLIDEKLFVNPSAKLKSEYTSDNLFFKSELSMAASNLGSVPLFAPKAWNAGSSYSHLGEIFNQGENSMMTYSTGSGEVTHHPGPVTLGMLSDMGWINVLFKHNEVKDIEAMIEPLVIETKIYSEEKITNDSVLLHYSTDNFITDNIVKFTTTDSILYTATIPVLTADSVKYYIEATTDLNRTYYHPSQGILPVESITKTFSFFIGTDLTPPVIVHQNILNIFNFDKILELTFGANDNLGLDSAYIEYKVNDGELIDLHTEFTGYSEQTDLYSFKSAISVENLEDGDTVYYRIIANDLSQVSNTTVLPDEGFFKVAILDYGTPVQVDNITFDEVGDVNLIIADGLSVFEPDGFSSICLNSPHPYLEGDPFPTDQIEYSAMLKFPVILKENEAYLRFDEIVIVEPGETGSVYGEQSFYDYVVVEGSVDSAKTWFSFEDGYDCRISNIFTSAYNNKINGSEGMYTSHIINLLANENLKGNDTVLMRFRLYSDQLSAGWGWAIDNIEIQPEIISVNESSFYNSDLKVYPNPSKGNFSLAVTSGTPIENYTLAVYNALGKQVFYEKNTASSKIVKHEIDISSLPAGMYFLSFESGNKIRSSKIVIE